MKKGLFNNLRYLTERFAFYGKSFLRDVDEVLNPTISTAEEAAELLRTTASVKDLYEIQKAVKGVYMLNGKIVNHIPHGEYTIYDDEDSMNKILFFNGVKNVNIDKEELKTAFNVLRAFSEEVDRSITAYCVRSRNGKYQYFFLLHLGKNGCGDFVDVDMKTAIKCFDEIKELGATWRSVTDIVNDIPDDVSSWAITYTVA